MKDEEFESIIETVLEEEGYKSEDIKGGKTIWGVSLRYHPDMKYLLTVSEEVAKEKAKNFYYGTYYLPFIDLSLPLRLCVVDAAVQFWIDDAIKILQRAINEIMGEQELKVDGIFGPKTKVWSSAVSIAYPQKLIFYYTIFRIRKYLENELFSENGKGWIERALDIMQKAIEELRRRG